MAVAAPTRQLLVVSESYHAGWRATINGSPQPVLRVNGDFLGCLVGPGKATVTLEFHPGSLRHGWTLSVAGLGLTAIFLVGGLVHFRRRWPEEDAL